MFIIYKAWCDGMWAFLAVGSPGEQGALLSPANHHPHGALPQEPSAAVHVLRFRGASTVGQVRLSGAVRKRIWRDRRRMGSRGGILPRSYLHVVLGRD